MEATPQIERHLTANMNISKKDIIIGNFLGGLAWGFGTVMGATVVVAMLGGILNTLGVFDGVKLFLEQLNALRELNGNLPQLPQRQIPQFNR